MLLRYVGFGKIARGKSGTRVLIRKLPSRIKVTASSRSEGIGELPIFRSHTRDIRRGRIGLVFLVMGD